jgi:hypothetical protein
MSQKHIYGGLITANYNAIMPKRKYKQVKEKKKVKLSLCLTNQALRHEDVWGSGHIDPHILDLGTS